MNPSDIEKLAELARLEIKPEALEEVSKGITNVIALVDQLAAADTQSVAPLAHPLDASGTLRPDRVTETDEREKFQNIAPAVEDGLYLVPKVIE